MAYRNGDLRRVPDFEESVAPLERTFDEFMGSVRVGARGAAKMEAQELVVRAQTFIAESERHDALAARLVAKLTGAQS